MKAPKGISSGNARLRLVWLIAGVVLFWSSQSVLAIDATFTVSLLPPTEVVEGQGSFIFVLRRTGSLAPVTVSFKITGTAKVGSDYTAPSSGAQFTQGAETVNITVSTINDTVPENNESVIFTIITSPISPGAYQVGNPSSATATIKDDEPTVTIEALPSQPFENATTITLNVGYKITRTGPTTSPLTVNIQMGGTATNGTDYTITLPAHFPAGISSSEVFLAAKDDAIIDPNETVRASLLSGQTYRVGTPSSATLTIGDNDPPKISLAISDGTAEEANISPATILVRRSGDLQQDLNVHYTVNPANQPILGTPATSGTDFVALSGTIVMRRFRPSENLVITPLNDSEIEGTEKILIRLSPSAVYDIGKQEETISIIDNDFPFVSISTTDGIASEAGQDPGTFRIFRTGSTASNLTVQFTIASTGTNLATRNVDFSLPIRIVGNAVTIPAGQSSADIAVTPVDDTEQETQEQITMSITQDAAYLIGNNSSASVFIADND